MNVLLVNPPYQTLTSNVGVGHQMPLGLLMVGGSLVDAGHRVKLLDAECRHSSLAKIVHAAREFGAEVVMTGHAGSTPAHPVCVQTLAAIKDALPHAVTIYGGVYPSYHAAQILRDHACVDVIVRGEGEATATDAVNRLGVLSEVPGITFRSRNGSIVSNADRAPIRDLDAHRVGWELIENWDAYTCFGMGRAGIVQFSRGCPHRCTYCGQHEFWVKWRHRDVTRFVDEVETLVRRRRVRFLTLADENPTTRRDVWTRLLTELAKRRLPVKFFATIRATDIVRDADIIHLYRGAGILYVLMGIESTREDVLRDVRKGSTPRHDIEACRLLSANGIYSILGHIVGLGDESRDTFRAARRALEQYEGDYLNAMYVTPHDWTPFGRVAVERELVETDLSKWDYRHQVLAEKQLSPAGLFFSVKLLELRFHLQPKRLARMLRERDPQRQRQLLWCAAHTGAVWLGEILEFLCRWRRSRPATKKRQRLQAPSAPPVTLVQIAGVSR